MADENLKKFLSEIQMLKRVRHEGVIHAGVPNPDSIAEHIVVASQIAYVLAKMEGANAERAATLCLFHENGEIRVGDGTWVSARYLDIKDAENKAEKEHYSNLPESISDDIMKLVNEKNERKTQESIIARDADKLELAIQCKVYVEQGYSGCNTWIINIESLLTTNSAKKIYKEIKNEPDMTNLWWQGLKKNPDNK